MYSHTIDLEFDRDRYNYRVGYEVSLKPAYNGPGMGINLSDVLKRTVSPEKMHVQDVA
jgi:hypothetical protein